MKQTNPKSHLTLPSKLLGNVGVQLFFLFCLLLSISILSVYIREMKISVEVEHGVKDSFFKNEYETACCSPDAKGKKTKQLSNAFAII